MNTTPITRTAIEAIAKPRQILVNDHAMPRMHDLSISPDGGLVPQAPNLLK
jgi:hypothetical protein